MVEMTRLTFWKASLRQKWHEVEVRLDKQLWRNWGRSAPRSSSNSFHWKKKKFRILLENRGRNWFFFHILYFLHVFILRFIIYSFFICFNTDTSFNENYEVQGQAIEFLLCVRCSTWYEWVDKGRYEYYQPFIPSIHQPSLSLSLILKSFMWKVIKTKKIPHVGLLKPILWSISDP